MKTNTKLSCFRAKLLLIWALLIALPLHAQTYPAHTSLYVNDFAELIDPETENRIDAALRKVKTDRGVEMTVVTIKNSKDYGPSPNFKAFAVGLFNTWGIGNATSNDGILVLVSKGDRKMRIVLGDGYSPVFDDRAKTIIESYFIPYFKKDQYAAGIEAGTYEVIKRIDTNYAPGFMDHATGIAHNAKSGGFWAWFLGLFGLGSAGAAAWGIKRWQRNRPRTCDQCGRKMQRLAEFADDEYLTQGQRVEEALKSKDYDVWYCQRDDHTIIEGYKGWFTKFSACPSCKFQTLHSQRTVLTAPTTSHSGKAKIEYNCRNCNHSYSETVILPRKIESSSSSGGGSSFGGGSSSGGGAGGSW